LPGAMRIGKKDLDRKPWANRSCPAISLPRPWRALVASVPSIRARMTRRVVRSTRVPTADLLRTPLRRSPSQCPGTVRAATSPGRSAMGVILYWGAGPDDRCPAPEAGAFCAPGAAPPRVHSAECHGARHTSPHKWSRSTGVSPYRQDTRVGAVRQSAQANTHQPAASARTATATGLEVCASAVADRLDRLPTCEPCRPNAVGPSSHCRRPRGSW
jgi:hypothetical protein